MNKILAFVAVSGLAACSREAERADNVSNKEFRVEVLFVDEDGCKVKRFSDYGYSRYYTSCPDGSTNTNWVEGCGKNCTQHMNIPGSRR